MNQILRLSLLATLAATTCAAHADDMFVGATVNAPYRTSLTFSDGNTRRTFESDSRAVPLKLYGGYNFNANFGIEAGYKDFGKTTIDPLPGSGNTFSTASRAMYVAGKGSMQLGESWSLFGKLGVTNTHTNFDATGDGPSDSGTVDRTGLYASVGAAYLLSKNVALTVELEHFGQAKYSKSDNVSFGMDGVALGARYSF